MQILLFIHAATKTNIEIMIALQVQQGHTVTCNTDPVKTEQEPHRFTFFNHHERQMSVPCSPAWLWENNRGRFNLLTQGDKAGWCLQLDPCLSRKNNGGWLKWLIQGDKAGWSLFKQKAKSGFPAANQQQLQLIRTSQIIKPHAKPKEQLWKANVATDSEQNL